MNGCFRAAPRTPDAVWPRGTSPACGLPSRGLLERTDGQLWVASALRWLDAVLAAPLPNVAWAAAMIDLIAELTPLLTATPNARGIFSPDPEPPMPPAAVPDNPMAARILAEQMRIVAMPGNPEVLQRRMAAVAATVDNLLSSLGWSVRDGELAAATAEAAGGMPGSLRD